MKAFVLCGGDGSRLRPYTYHTPKPMLPIAGKPILQYVLENLKKGGVDEVILTVGPMYEKIKEYFKSGEKIGMKIHYSIEEKKLNTAGSILPKKDLIDGDFIVAMGDHITDINIKELIKRHKESGAIATLSLLKKQVPMQFGIAELDEKGYIKELREKPLLEYYINTAIYAFKPEIYNYIREGDDFSHHVFPRLLENGEKMAAYIFEGGWYDVGTVSAYKKLSELFDAAVLIKHLREE